MLSNKVPKSEIIFKENCNINNKSINKDKIDYCKRIAIELYLKYIAIDSEYEINISSDMRNILIKYLDNSDTWMNNINVNENDLFILFDDCRSEVYKLMVFSFTRIKSVKMSKIQAILRNEST